MLVAAFSGLGESLLCGTPLGGETTRQIPRDSARLLVLILLQFPRELQVTVGRLLKEAGCHGRWGGDPPNRG